MLFAVIVPLVGAAIAMVMLWGRAFRWTDVALLVTFYVLCAFGTTIGFHRYFTHKGFDARLPVKVTLGILGCMTMQGPIIQWVTDHRKHHAHSDQPGDPHSPHVGHGDGFWGAARGFAHAHVGWMFSNLGMEQGRVYGKDLYEDRVLVWLDRMYVIWVAISLGIPFAIGYLLGGGSVALGLEALVWGGLFRIFLYQHATFSVNSICHMFGTAGVPLARRGAQQLGRRAARLRGGLAQQPSRLPGVGSPRSEPVPVRRVLVGDPHHGACPARVERQDAVGRPARSASLASGELTNRRSSSSTSSPSGRLSAAAGAFPTAAMRHRGARRE